MSWVYLTHLLEELSNHSTFLGKLWFTLLVVFRIVLTVLGGESIYSDEQGAFVCNTLQPGCENMCYDAFAPLSHARFWVFQIIIIATPTILYLSFALHKIAPKVDHQSNGGPPVNQGVSCQYEKDKVTGDENSIIHVEIEPDQEKKKAAEAHEKHDRRSPIKQGGLMKLYIVQLFARMVLEMVFLYGQYVLYGFKVPANYLCKIHPCPNTVDCFVSRPTEKTIFLLIMYTVSVLCLLLTLLEILQLATSCIRNAFRTRHQSAKTKTENLVYVRHTSSPPPGYKTALERDIGNTSAEGEYDLGDFGHMAPDDEVSSQEVNCQRENLKLAKQQLDQSDEGNSVQSSLNFKKEEKKTGCYGKGKFNEEIILYN
ncbi:Gap junction gamma-1 protein [Bagarius yarrelli]|uniref:Gap junction protein n=1 Tax=Bagarius yarrelli TaxID=175774 RepID=A0A556TZJ1_BAGYA|nr:Gap junction gamma-1 protein [Bagarius yarrelli]